MLKLKWKPSKYLTQRRKNSFSLSVYLREDPLNDEGCLWLDLRLKKKGEKVKDVIWPWLKTKNLEQVIIEFLQEFGNEIGNPFFENWAKALMGY